MNHRTLLFVPALLAAAPAPAAAIPPPPQVVVGVLTEQHTRRCLARGQVEWINPYYEVGFTRLLPVGKLALQSLIGKPVLVWGATQSAYQAPTVKHTGECPIAQMRSDWVEAKSGFRIRRSKLPFTAVSTGKVEPLTGFSVTSVGGFIRVTFRNPVTQALKTVTLTMHYEGCYGKPGSRAKDQVFASVPPGKSVTATFPKVVGPDGAAPTGVRTKRRPGNHIAYSVSVSASAPTVFFDFDWQLGLSTDPSLKLSCP